MTYWLFLKNSDDLLTVSFWFAIENNYKNNQKKIVNVSKGQGLPDFIPSNASVVFVLPAKSILLIEQKWPKNLNLDKRTLIYAFEDRIVNEPEDVHIEVLHRDKDIIKVAIINKKIIAAIEYLAKLAKIISFKITSQSLLIPIYENEWSLWHSDEGLLFRFDKYLAMSLPQGAESATVDIKLALSIKNNSAPTAITIYEYQKYLDYHPNTKFTVKVQSDDREVIEFLDEQQVISLSPKNNNFLEFYYLIKNVFASVAKPAIALCLILILFLLGNYLKLKTESDELQKNIVYNFNQVFPKDAVRTKNPLAQIENKYLETNQNSKYDFSQALANAISALNSDSTSLNNQTNSKNKIKNIHWQNEVLTIEFFTTPIINPQVSNNFIVAVEGNKLRVNKNPSFKY